MILLASYNIHTLIKSLPGNIAQGLIWGLLAIGLFITYKLLNFSDLTVDGSFATGAAITIALISLGIPAPLAILVAFVGGMLCGYVTGFLHTVCHIAPILAGILTQIGLYSINLHILGNKANKAINVDNFDLMLSSRYIPKAILISLIVVAIMIGFMYWFFGTEIGSAIRATGNNEEMSKAQGINTSRTKVLALMISNGIVAIAGGLLAQYQGYADVQIGRGALVIGLAAIIIGEVLLNLIFRSATDLWVQLSFVIIGGILYYFAMGVVLWLKLPTNDMKLFTAILVAIFLSVPNMKHRKKGDKAHAGN